MPSVHRRSWSGCRRTASRTRDDEALLELADGVVELDAVVDHLLDQALEPIADHDQSSSRPVRRWNASTYFSRVFATTSSGSDGTGGCLFQRIAFEVVADELLVEARLRAAGAVAVLRPEARRVGRQHLVDQDDAILDRPAVAVVDRQQAELELGVGDDDAARLGVRGAVGVEPQRQLACTRSSTRLPTSAAASASVMLMSWPLCALVAGVKIGSRQPIGFAQPCRAA